MPLVKRRVDCPHLCGAVQPEGISSGPECVTNTTLSAIIRQLSCLSKQAEDVFGELFSEANAFYVRANTLQDRINRMTFKIMQLGSSVEEVFLQDINMRKAFRSATAQDQQVVSKSSIPNSVAEMYNSGDKPPSLYILSAYRWVRRHFTSLCGPFTVQSAECTRKPNNKAVTAMSVLMGPWFRYYKPFTQRQR